MNCNWLTISWRLLPVISINLASGIPRPFQAGGCTSTATSLYRPTQFYRSIYQQVSIFPNIHPNLSPATNICDNCEVVQARIFCAPPRTPPEMICTPPVAFGTAPQSFCTPANYIYFDLIVSYLIILTTKFVTLPILWSQISPCRPGKQILLNFFRALPPGPGPKQAAAPPPPRYLSTPPNENMKIRL